MSQNHTGLLAAFLRRRHLSVLAAIATLIALSIAPFPRVYAKGERPRLVVVVVIDQMRYDYLVRFAGLYTGGLKRFLDQGADFTDAHHDHAITVTAAGHATLSTGAFPSHHGIVGNDWFDRAANGKVYATSDPNVRILGDPSGAGQSPRNILRTSLGDWLKAASPRSKVFSVALKDRSAIAMGGQHPDGAYWYDSAGKFVTSTYYLQTSYPAWVNEFNTSGRIDEHFAEGWKRLLSDDAYFLSREDRFEAEADGEHTTFPYVFDDGTPDARARYYREIWNTPFGDELAIDFAEQLVTSEKLGDDNDPDLLWLSCSTADVIGHRYGPLSQEAEDAYLRLDRKLGELFAVLDSRVGAGNYMIALSADHGVLPMPEELQRRGISAERVSAGALSSMLNDAVRGAAHSLGIEQDMVAYAGWDGVYLNLSPAVTAHATASQIRQAVAERLRQLPIVLDAYTAEELEATEPGREFLDAFRHSFVAARSADVMIRFKPNSLVGIGAHGTTHGSPYEYDTHVPLVFAGYRVRAGAHPERVRTVDLATTLADFLKCPTPLDVDGISLRKTVVQRAR